MSLHNINTAIDSDEKITIAISRTIWIAKKEGGNKKKEKKYSY